MKKIKTRASLMQRGIESLHKKGNSYVSAQSSKKASKVAFTLAETLITIGIIGVVSALTIPTLITNYQKKVTAQRLKVFNSQLNQAVRLAEADYGNPSGWTYPTASSSTHEQLTEDYIKTYFMPYFKNSQYYSMRDIKKIHKMVGLNGNELTVPNKYTPGLMLSDGRIMRFYPSDYNTTLQGLIYIWILVDINGLSGPNRVGKDIFVFDSYSRNGAGPTYKITLYGANNSNAKNECDKNNSGMYAGWTCGQVIKDNNWAIPSDYPW